MRTRCDSASRARPRVRYLAAVDEDVSISKAPAIVVVAVFTAIIALVVITLAYSTVNTPISVDGKKAQYSHNLPSGK
jgi:hypothetical protein